MERFNLDGEEIKPLTICLIGGGGFIGSHLCEKLLLDTSHKVIVIDIHSCKIKHLICNDSPWLDRIQFHTINIECDNKFEPLIRASDLVINLASVCTPADYNNRPLKTITNNLLIAIPVVDCCVYNKKRLIHFSSCEVYGKTIGSFLPKDHPLSQDPKFYLLNEDTSPFILGPIDKQRWSYACAKQMTERLIYAELAESGLDFTIVRPFNLIGARMDFIPGDDGPREEVPRVLACFASNLLRGQPLKLVDGGKSQRTFCCVKDAVEAVLLMIENPRRANGQIFNVGNPDNEVTIKQLAELMIQVYAKLTRVSASEFTTIDVSSRDFYGAGYDDSDKRMPDITSINGHLGWRSMTPLRAILEKTLSYINLERLAINLGDINFPGLAF